MPTRKINLETLEADRRWADVVQPNLRDTLRRLREVQRQEQKKPLADQYFDYEEDEDAD